MRFYSLEITSLLSFAFCPSILALTITSPTADSTIDPTQAITVTWTSSSSDPSAITLTLTNASPSVLAQDETLASNILTSLGSYTVPADVVQNFGTGFVINAIASDGKVVASSAQFALGAGSNEVSTVSGGGQTFVSVFTAVTENPTASDTATPVQTTTRTTNAGSTANAASGTGSSSTVSVQSPTPSPTSSAASGTVLTNTASQTTTKSSKSSSRVTSETIFDSSPGSGTPTAQATSTSSALAVSIGSGGQVVAGALGMVVALFGVCV